MEPITLAKESSRVSEKCQYCDKIFLFFCQDGNLPSGESFIRQFLLGQRFFEKEFGKKSTVVSNCFLF